MARIAVGSDHRGDEAAAAVRAHLGQLGHQVASVSTAPAGESRDYPDEAGAVAESIRRGRADLGVLICGSGIGVSMAANRYTGVRAVLARDVEDAVMSRRHNDSNVLCLGADRTPIADMIPMLDAWLAAEFEGGRHQRRVDKMDAAGCDAGSVTA